MEGERFEQKLRDYFIAEVQQVEPSREWWTNIVTGLRERKLRSRWGFMPRTRLAWALLPLILLLVGGTAYGANFIVRELFCKYAGHVEEAGLAEELVLSQTVEGVTVRLERAYADANVVLVGFTVSGPGERYSIISELSTSEGQDIPGMFGIGVVPGSDIIMGEWGGSERLAMIFSFDSSLIQGSPQELNLRLETKVSEFSIPVVNEILTLTGPFIFEFSVPFHAGKIVSVEQTVDAAGMPVTLEKVVITPWATKAIFSMSDETESRYCPIVSLKLPNGDLKNCSFSKAAELSSCQYFIGDFTGQSGEWTVVISGLVSPFAHNELVVQFGEDKIEVVGKEGGDKQIAAFHFEVP